MVIAPATTAATQPVVPIIGTITATAQPVVQPLTTTAQPLSQVVANTAQPLVQPVTQAVSAAAQPIAATVAPVVQPVVDAILPAVAPVAQPVVELVQPVVQPILDVVGSAAPLPPPPAHPAVSVAPATVQSLSQPAAPHAIRPAADPLLPVTAPPVAVTPPGTARPVTDAAVGPAVRLSPIAASASALTAASTQRPAALSAAYPAAAAREPIGPADQTATAAHSQVLVTEPILAASAEAVAIAAVAIAAVAPRTAVAPPATEQPAVRATTPAALPATSLVFDTTAMNTTEASPDRAPVAAPGISGDAMPTAAVTPQTVLQHADRLIERAATGATAGQRGSFGVPVLVASSLPATPSLSAPLGAPAVTAPPVVLPATGTLAGTAEGSGSSGFAAYMGALALLAISLHTLARLLWITRCPAIRGYALLVPPA